MESSPCYWNNMEFYTNLSLPKVITDSLEYCIVQITVNHLFRHRFTVNSMVAIEISSRCKMFTSLENTLEGRAVIQAFEKLDEFRNE